jgi:signal transduction histidine kinase/FixJ family two-component response regulator
VTRPSDRELLILIFALFGRDAEATRRILGGVSIESEVCHDIDALCAAIERGAGALVLAEEALVPSAAHRLIAVLGAQPSWSDLPVIVSATEVAEERRGFGLLSRLGEGVNLSILERPVRARAMVSAVQSALRARRRQYATRRLIDELSASEVRFRTVQERAPYGLMIYRPVFGENGAIEDFEWIYANAVGARAMKRPISALIGRRHLELMPGKIDGHFQAHVAAFTSGVAVDREFFYEHDGSDNTYHLTAFRLDENLAVVFDDITERKRAELERAQLLAREREARTEAEAASRGKDEFLATVSHELRTPLNAMLGWARLLTSGTLPENARGKAVQSIERNALAQAQLIEDLLDVSRIVSGKLRLDLHEVDFPRLVEAAVDSVRPAMEAKEIRLQPAIDPSASQVMGDPNRLQQVIWNLLSNAIKFTPRGGRVQLTVARVKSHIELSVSDTGLGIEPSFLPFLFQRFYQADGTSTRNQGGLGLGLAICRHLVELHGGTIEAFSEGLGQGATFKVQLPVLPVRATRADARAAPPTPARPLVFEPPPELQGLKVLIVDDQPDARELLAAVMTRCGAMAIEASSSSEGLGRVMAARPDVIISDIGMPEEDGYSFIRRVRKLAADAGGRTPAAALTAYARAEDRRQAIQAGFEMHVPKPVEPAELVTVVATLARIGRAMSHDDKRP